MASSTTIAVSPEVRQALRELAVEAGDTMDSLIKRLLRDERARRMGAALAVRRSQMTAEEITIEQSLIVGTAVRHALR